MTSNLSISKHTPGPWYCHGGAVYMRPFPDTSGCIANMDREEPETAPWERDANTRLIAAAPELLEALKPLQLWAENERREASAKGWEGEAAFMGELADNAKAAIAKAEGN